MPKQEDSPTLPITLGLRSLGKKAGSRLLTIVREVVRASGKQESVAEEIGISPEMFSQALSGQRSFRIEWLPTILRYDHEQKILKYLAWEAGCRVEKVDPLTKEQKYDLLIAELRRGAADVEALERRAYAEGEDES